MSFIGIRAFVLAPQQHSELDNWNEFQNYRLELDENERKKKELLGGDYRKEYQASDPNGVVLHYEWTMKVNMINIQLNCTARRCDNRAAAKRWPISESYLITRP